MPPFTCCPCNETAGDSPFNSSLCSEGNGQSSISAMRGTVLSLVVRLHSDVYPAIQDLIISCVWLHWGWIAHVRFSVVHDPMISLFRTYRQSEPQVATTSSASFPFGMNQGRLTSGLSHPSRAPLAIFLSSFCFLISSLLTASCHSL